MDKKKEYIMMLKFVLFSISAGVIQVGSFTLLNEFVFKSGYWITTVSSLEKDFTSLFHTK